MPSSSNHRKPEHNISRNGQRGRPGSRWTAARWITTHVLVLMALPVGALGLQVEFPWAKAGWSEREAAAHLLDRFAYGPRPGDIDAVLEMGLEAWFELQLTSAFDDTSLERRLRPLDAWQMSRRELRETFPDPGRLLRRRYQNEGMEGAPDPSNMSQDEQRSLRESMREEMQADGLRSRRELAGQLMVHKLLRAVYAENALHEVLTDFWFNHFNVSLSDNQAFGFVLSYERDAIRPHLTGSFHELLEATAMHPAMLHYLDNAQSRAEEGQRTAFDRSSLARRMNRSGVRGRRSRSGRGLAELGIGPRNNRGGVSGLNENYARELLELHTLGVDGGYTQEDVVEVARAFTGWTVLPPDAESRLSRLRAVGGPQALGFVIEDDFLFHPDFHDAESKEVLGQRLPAGRGLEDGRDVLRLLSAHPSTASHLSRKLAARFVADEPPEALVAKLTATFLRTGGDLSALVLEIPRSAEFWSQGSRRQKIKSPFELAASALRALDADILHPRELVEWVMRMGQPLYRYEAPTGYPDRASHWVSSGSLLNRMNFGLQLASGGVRGVEHSLARLNGNREPESLDEALMTYARLLLPERDVEATVQQLQAAAREANLSAKISQEAPAPRADESSDEIDFPPTMSSRDRERRGAPRQRSDEWRTSQTLSPLGASDPIAQVVGLILGSPEFQRR